MISKLARIKCPKGTFIDIVKIWQMEWFYMIEPRDAAWTMAPEFRSRPPTRLTSWTRKGLDLGPTTEVEALQKRVSNMIKVGAKLTNMV